MTDASLTDQPSRTHVSSLPAIPASVALAILWIVAMLAVASFAETIAPYGFTRSTCAIGCRRPAMPRIGSAPTSSAATCCHG